MSSINYWKERLLDLFTVKKDREPGTSRLTQRIDEMAIKKNTSKSTKPAAKAPVASPGKAPAAAISRAPSAAPVSSTPVRNSPIPKVPAAAPVKKEFSHDQIAKRAYEISISGTGGSEEDNWYRALRELNA